MIILILYILRKYSSVVWVMYVGYSYVVLKPHIWWYWHVCHGRISHEFLGTLKRYRLIQDNHLHLHSTCQTCHNIQSLYVHCTMHLLIYYLSRHLEERQSWSLTMTTNDPVVLGGHGPASNDHLLLDWPLLLLLEPHVDIELVAEQHGDGRQHRGGERAHHHLVL